MAKAKATKTAAGKPTEWANRIIRLGVQAADQFVHNPNNPRVHPQAQREAVAGSLNTLGWIDPVLVNVRTGYLIDGHERIWHALQNNNAPVPFIEVDLSPEEEALAITTFDYITTMASYDPNILTDLMAQIDTDNTDVLALLDTMKDEFGLTVDDSITDGVFGEHNPSLEPANAMAVIGEYRIELERSVYEQWREDIQAEAGMKPERIKEIILERLHLS